MFKPKMNINVNMSGEEYIRYKEKKRIRITKNKVIGYGIISFSLVGGMFLIASILGAFTPEPIISNVPQLMSMSWSDLIKYGLIVAYPFIVVSWVLHGFQIRILA